jgi:hypothetical protein
MTTIAWDGTSVAADTQITCEGMRRRSHKLTVTDTWIYGHTGMEADCERVARWVLAGADLDRPPDLDDGEGAHGLLVNRTTGEVFTLAGKNAVPRKIEEAFHATGSGRDYAVAAMALGKTAAEAVSLAARFDVFTGEPVDVVQVRP